MDRLDYIILEEIDNVVSRGGMKWELWPKETRAERFGVSNAMRSKSPSSSSSNSFDVIRGREDWLKNFKSSGMSFHSYCDKFGLRY